MKKKIIRLRVSADIIILIACVHQALITPIYNIGRSSHTYTHITSIVINAMLINFAFNQYS